jgi:hypothetical protein
MDGMWLTVVSQLMFLNMMSSNTAVDDESVTSSRGVTRHRDAAA